LLEFLAFEGIRNPNPDKRAFIWVDHMDCGVRFDAARERW
jgi:hypothetical protein